jgi:mannosyl-3-phosphoglycerate phosphatase
MREKTDPMISRTSSRGLDYITIFTDLDGTLLDRDTYSFGEAEEALARIGREGVPLILASSKTRAEVEFFRNLMHNVHPFIVENGGAAFIPAGYFADNSIEPVRPKEQDSVRLRLTADYLVAETGLPYARVRRALAEVRERTGFSIRGFGDLRPEEIAEISSLSLDQAKRARMREYAEPFVMSEPRTERTISIIREVVTGLGLRFTVGEKFLHLSGRHDKGRLVRMLIAMFRSELRDKRRNLKTVALGDGKNDVEMLLECEVRFLIKKKDGVADPEVLSRVPGARVYEPGPAGWNTAVIDLLRSRNGRQV